MKYEKSKYAFAVSRKLPGAGEICLFFSGRTAKNVYVTPSVFQKVMSGDFDDISDDVRNKLTEQKILVPETEDELSEVNKENRRLLNQRQKENDLLYVSVQPTAYCQLACDYCGQQHSKKNMTDEIMEAVVKRVAEKLSGTSYKRLEIGWFGGEPLCAIGKMRKLNRQLKSMAREKNVGYGGHVTTNGYALTPGIYKELKENFNIRQIEITLDGSKEYHDKRRVTSTGKGSFDRIIGNLEAVVSSDCYDKENCLISVRCNVDERNVEGVFPLLETFVAKKLQSKIAFYTTYVYSWGNNGAGSEEGRKLLAKYSANHLAYMIENEFGVCVLPSRVTAYNCIGTCKDSEMYDAEGNIFDCSETSYSDYYERRGFVLGNVMKDGAARVCRSKLNTVPDMLLRGEIKPCNECKFYPLCGGVCPMALLDGSPRCPSYVYNIEDLIFLDFLSKNRKKPTLES